MTWQPLSQRRSGSAPDGPYEGVPEHLAGHLTDWLKRGLARGFGKVAKDVAIQLRLPLPPGLEPNQTVQAVINSAQSQDALLDTVDATLHALSRRNVAVQAGEDLAMKLRQLLNDGASVWTVTDDGNGLIEVIEQHTQRTYEDAIATQDDAANELRTAWTNAFGRNGDPSDAWDHAIKAVEDTLAPIVIPNVAKPTLGQVIGALDSQAHIWKFTLPGNDQSHSVGPLVTILRLMWPNHDRHGGAPKRTPSMMEARSVVTLAALIIQWHRQGWVVARR